MTDQLTITVSGPQGAGRTALAQWIIAALGYDRGRRRHHSLHESTADLIAKFDAVDETPGGLEIGRYENGLTIVIRTQTETTTAPQPNTCGTPDREMDAAMVDAGMMSTADFVKAHGDNNIRKFGDAAEQFWPGEKTDAPPTDARTAAADRVRKAVDALNDVVLAAKDQGVFCDFTVVDYGSFVGNTQIVSVTCNARI